MNQGESELLVRSRFEAESDLVWCWFGAKSDLVLSKQGAESEPVRTWIKVSQSCWFGSGLRLSRICFDAKSDLVMNK